nr:MULTISPECIES: DUF4145 domain-containing protein [unclassified Pseudomonas]
MHAYVPPSFEGSAFNCPLCGAFANMIWADIYNGRQDMYHMGLYQCECAHCRQSTCWLGTEVGYPDGHSAGVMIHPDGTMAPLAHPEMPEHIKSDYLEARSIVGRSPRGAAALLRLAIQKLCEELGETSGNINTDIGSLVKKGLPVEIQQALDVVRVIGNNAVHPGKLSDADIAGVANALFGLVNEIVEDRIARPKKLAALFASLPNGAREAIEKRDAPKTT